MILPAADQEAVYGGFISVKPFSVIVLLAVLTGRRAQRFNAQIFQKLPDIL